MTLRLNVNLYKRGRRFDSRQIGNLNGVGESIQFTFSFTGSIGKPFVAQLGAGAVGEKSVITELSLLYYSFDFHSMNLLKRQELLIK